MKTSDRLKAIEASEDRWRAQLSNIPYEDVEVMRLIRVASQGISAFTDPVLRGGGLTESSYHTLIIVATGRAKVCTVTQLCDQVGQTRANMTRIVKLLESEGLALSQSDPRDARRKQIVATSKGKKWVREYSERLDPVVALAMSGVTTAEKGKLKQVLRKMITAMSRAEAEAQRLA